MILLVQLWSMNKTLPWRENGKIPTYLSHEQKLHDTLVQPTEPTMTLNCAEQLCASKWKIVSRTILIWVEFFFQTRILKRFSKFGTTKVEKNNSHASPYMEYLVYYKGCHLFIEMRSKPSPTKTFAYHRHCEDIWKRQLRFSAVESKWFHLFLKTCQPH